KNEMRERRTVNAVRSGIIVIGSLGFGYLTLQFGFKPFLQKAQQQEALTQDQTKSTSTTHDSSSYPKEPANGFLNFDSGMEEKCKDSNEENWMGNCDRRRGMAIVQVLCCVVYATYLLLVYYHRHDDQSETSSNDKKRKASACEGELKRTMEAINDVAKAIREGNAIVEGVPQIYSEEEVFAELVNLGVEEHLGYKAYIFHVEDAARVRALFDYPVEGRTDFLIQMLCGLEDP
ncbi:LOW QUALITY PROTEIN: hypothetical protein CFOL_v3_04436, partial [Cephalotus follicularis]